jgi:hypothetical protein
VMKVNPSRQFSTSENSALGFSTTGMMSNPWQRKPLVATWRLMCLWVLKYGSGASTCSSESLVAISQFEDSWYCLLSANQSLRVKIEVSTSFC